MCEASHIASSCALHLLQIQMLQDNGSCKSLCISSIPADNAKFINDRIREDYALNWLVDGLPAAEMKIDVKSGDMFFDMGFNLGNNDGPHAEQPALNNHYDIVLRYDLCQVLRPDAHGQHDELQTPLSQPWENPHRWRPRVALEVPIKHAPLYALLKHISF